MRRSSHWSEHSGERLREVPPQRKLLRTTRKVQIIRNGKTVQEEIET